MKKLAYMYMAAITSIGVILVIVVWAALMGFFDMNPYTDTVTCTITADTSQAAIGDVFVFVLDDTESVKLQKSQCVNMETATVGDTFTAIVVTDEEGVLQCITRVTY